MVFYFFCTLLLCTNTFIASDRVDFKCSVASNSDIPGILSIIQQISSTENDSQKVVVLPTRFQEGALKKDISLGRLFVAKNSVTGKVIGYKKLFLFHDTDELKMVMKDEIRCSDLGAKKVDSGFIEYDSHYTRTISDSIFFTSLSDVYCYTGADYVDQKHRGYGVSTAMYRYAFESLQSQCDALAKYNNTYPCRLILLYGLTHLNDYDDAGRGVSRTPSIVKAVDEFVKKGGHEGVKFMHYRYRAYMPTFALDSTECVPLPDEKAVAGYGNVLVAYLNKKDGLLL
jgi:hypothetical protein